MNHISRRSQPVLVISPHPSSSSFFLSFLLYLLFFFFFFSFSSNRNDRPTSTPKGLGTFQTSVRRFGFDFFFGLVQAEGRESGNSVCRGGVSQSETGEPFLLLTREHLDARLILR